MVLQHGNTLFSELKMSEMSSKNGNVWYDFWYDFLINLFPIHVPVWMLFSSQALWAFIFIVGLTWMTKWTFLSLSGCYRYYNPLYCLYFSSSLSPSQEYAEWILFSSMPLMISPLPLTPEMHCSVYHTLPRPKPIYTMQYFGGFCLVYIYIYTYISQ